jgi:large subunit ribosomal protein L25
MEISELKAEKREVAGKESSKKLRKQGLVPAVVYSDGKATSITVNAREFSALTHSGAGTHVIVKLKVEGAKKQPNAIIKAIQHNPIKNEYFHIDFQEIALDEKIKTSLSIVVVGDSPGVKLGGMLENHLWEVEVEGVPQNMPDHLEVDISSLEIGDSLHVSDLAIPDNVTIMADPSTAILAISAPRTEQAEAAAEASAAEGQAAIVGEAATE